MNEKFDKITEQVLIEAIDAAHTARQKMEEYRAKRLWQEVNVPCSLADALNRLTKREMDEIRKNLGFKGLSSLKKAELASELAKLIPAHYEDVISLLDQGRYNFVKMLSDNSGVLTGYEIEDSLAEQMVHNAIVFTGLCQGQPVLFIPTELVKTFQRIDCPRLQTKIARNTEWILLTQGLIHYYGVMEVGDTIKRISQLTGQQIDYLEFIPVISSAIDFYQEIDYSYYGFQDRRILEPSKIIDEHRARPDLTFYPFTKQHLLRAGNPGYYDQTPAMRDFISFLSRHYDLTDKEIDEFAVTIINMINLDYKPTTMIEYLQSRLEFPSFEFVQELVQKLMNVHNNTRQWVLKGHTPSELFEEEKKHLLPLPPKPFMPGQTNSKVIDIKTRAKIGRNDPCPCGSGKKFKRCCGRHL